MAPDTAWATRLLDEAAAIVEAVTSRWGIHEGTTHVWAEFERSDPRGTHLWAELERPGPRIGEDAKPEE